MYFKLAFGNDYEQRYMKFLEAYGKMFELSFMIETTLYTLRFEEVKEIFEIFKNNEIRDFIISDKFYYKLINKNFVKKIKDFDDIYENEIYEIFMEIVDIQIEIIIS